MFKDFKFTDTYNRVDAWDCHNTCCIAIPCYWQVSRGGWQATTTAAMFMVFFFLSWERCAFTLSYKCQQLDEVLSDAHLL